MSSSLYFSDDTGSPTTRTTNVISIFSPPVDDYHISKPQQHHYKVQIREKSTAIPLRHKHKSTMLHGLRTLIALGLIGTTTAWRYRYGNCYDSICVVKFEGKPLDVRCPHFCYEPDCRIRTEDWEAFQQTGDYSEWIDRGNVPTLDTDALSANAFCGPWHLWRA